MALEAASDADLHIDLSDLDKIDAVLSCGHRLRVHRERIGQTQPCARCEIETGTLTRAVIGLDGPLPPARRHYRPPIKRGFVTEFTVSDELRRPWTPKEVDTRTHTQRLADEQEADLARGIGERRKRPPSKHAGMGKGWATDEARRRLPASLDHLRRLVAERDGAWVTTKEWNRVRGDSLGARTLVAQLAVESWAEVLAQAGCGAPKPNRTPTPRNMELAHAAKSARSKMRLEASRVAFIELCERLGRVATVNEYDQHRGPGTLSNRGVVKACGDVSWKEWVTSLGFVPIPKNGGRSIPSAPIIDALEAERRRRGMRTLTDVARVVHPERPKSAVDLWRNWRKSGVASSDVARTHLAALGLDLYELVAEPMRDAA